MAEELLQGYEYKKTSGRVNYIISVDYSDVHGQVTRYLGKLIHFLRIPHQYDPDDTSTQHLKEPLRIAMVSFFKHQQDTLGTLRPARLKGNPNTHMIRAMTNEYDGEYYAVDALKIVNKHVIAQHGPHEIFAMTYVSLGSH